MGLTLSKAASNTFNTCNPEVLITSFINSIEEALNVSCVHRYFYTALFQETQASNSIFQRQKAMIDILEQKCGFNVDCRDFKHMSVYCPNNRCKHSHFPINRKVQAEVDVAIATKSLLRAAKNEYDVLIVITGDRDFKDCFTSISSEFGKDVKILGFHGSTWFDYYDKFYGIEVVSCEKVWEKAIGKSLFNKDIHARSEFCLDNKKEEVKRNGHNDYKHRGASKNSRDPRSKSRTPAGTMLSNKAKPFKGKNGKGKHAPLPKSKNAAIVKLESGKYFDAIEVSSIEDVMKKYNVDEFTAELALYATNGDSRSFDKIIN
jgi:uncharacterized LabA/DUF88 family protein